MADNHHVMVEHQERAGNSEKPTSRNNGSQKNTQCHKDLTENTGWVQTDFCKTEAATRIPDWSSNMCDTLHKGMHLIM